MYILIYKSIYIYYLYIHDALPKYQDMMATEYTAYMLKLSQDMAMERSNIVIVMSHDLKTTLPPTFHLRKKGPTILINHIPGNSV